jgi:hypothetical protein
MLLKVFCEIKREGELPKSFCEASNTFILKLEKTKPKRV